MSHQAAWKLQGRFGFVRRPSLLLMVFYLQGDPSAPACLVAFLCEPIRRIQLLWPAVSISQYADDVLFLSCDAAQLRQAHDYFTHWLHWLWVLLWLAMVWLAWLWMLL